MLTFDQDGNWKCPYRFIFGYHHYFFVVSSHLRADRNVYIVCFQLDAFLNRRKTAWYAWKFKWSFGWREKSKQCDWWWLGCPCLHSPNFFLSRCVCSTGAEGCEIAHVLLRHTVAKIVSLHFNLNFKIPVIKTQTSSHPSSTSWSGIGSNRKSSTSTSLDKERCHTTVPGGKLSYPGQEGKRKIVPIQNRKNDVLTRLYPSAASWNVRNFVHKLIHTWSVGYQWGTLDDEYLSYINE